MRAPIDIYQTQLELDVRKLKHELQVLEQQTQMKRSELNNHIRVLTLVKETQNANRDSDSGQ
jgi:hypothetical protein